MGPTAPIFLNCTSTFSIVGPLLFDSGDIARSWYMEAAGDFVIKYGFGTGQNQKCMSTFSSDTALLHEIASG